MQAEIDKLLPASKEAEDLRDLVEQLQNQITGLKDQKGGVGSSS